MKYALCEDQIFVTQTIPVESDAFPFNVLDVKFPSEVTPVIHDHYCMELTYVLEGTGEYYIAGKNYAIKKGDFLIINGHEYHGLMKNGGELEIAVIAFHPDMVWQGTNDMDYRYLQTFYNGTEDFYHYFPADHPIMPGVSAICVEIMEEWAHRSLGYELIIKANLLKVLALLYRGLESSAAHSVVTTKFHDDYNRISPCVKYIEDHLCEPITLKDLAQVAHMNTSYFSTVFKRIMKSSPTEYILKKRLAGTRILLKTTNLQVMEIAFACGFSDLSAFNKKFKSEYHLTPLQYRRSGVL